MPDSADSVFLLEEATDEVSVVQLFEHRWRIVLAESAEYQYESAMAWDYYANIQNHLEDADDPEVEPLTANVIRRDLDQMTSRVLDADMVVNPKGRFEKDYSTGELLVDLLQYTRDEEIDWDNDQEDAIQDCFHTGEGVIMEQWDQSRAKGRGMPRADWVDTRYFGWDPASRKWHHQDANYVLYYPPFPVNTLKRKWDLEHVDADFPGPLGGRSDQLGGSSDQQGGEPQSIAVVRARQGRYAEPMAFEKHMWSKKDRYKTVYIDIETREVAMVPGLDGENRPMRAEDYKLLPEIDRAQYKKDRQKTEELWHTIIVNQQVVKNEISIYDVSNGGHGMYPFAWYTYVRIRNRSHGKGEISYLKQIQDLTNQLLRRWLEQLVVASTNYLVTEQGSMPIEDEEKVINGSADPVQLLRTNPGFKAPQIIGGTPGGADVLQAGFAFLSTIKDKLSGVYGVQRGEMPYQTSGKGIRALQSEADLLGVMPRRHIESGHRQATILRLSNILQFMNAERMVEIADRSSGDPAPLYIGRSMEQIQAKFDLQPWKEGELELVDNKGVPLAFQDPHRPGEKAKVLVIGKGSHDLIDWARIELELDTNKERNREERMQFAEVYLDKLGPVAAEWSLDLQDAPNKDLLLNSIKEANKDAQMRKQIEEAAQQLKVQPDQLMQHFMQQIAQAVEQQQGAPQEE